MQNSAKNVKDYLRQLPDDRRPVVTKLRNLCARVLTGYEESMDYGMPCYKRNGHVEVAFASQKNYISIYGLKKGVIDSHRPQLVTAKVGKGCIRYSKPEKLDFALIEKLLVATRKSEEIAC